MAPGQKNIYKFTRLNSRIMSKEPKQEYEYIGECKGNNGNGCFMDNPAHNCGCFVRKPKQETTSLEEAAERIFPEDVTQDNAPKLTEELISGLRLLSETFTYEELQGILDQLYYVKKEGKQEFYFDQIKLNAKGCDTMSAFQYGYFDTLSALGEN